MRYYIISFVSTALLFNWWCIFNLSCSNKMRRNVICSTAATVLFTCYKHNEIKYSPWDRMCRNLKWGLFLSIALITLKREGNPSCFMLNGVNSAVTARIGTIVLTKSSIECHTLLSSNSTLQYQRSGVTWHQTPSKGLQNIPDISWVNYYDNLSNNSSNTKIQQQSLSHLLYTISVLPMQCLTCLPLIFSANSNS